MATPDPDVFASAREHLARAELFRVEAASCTASLDRWRRLVASAHFARAIAETLMTQADMGRLPGFAKAHIENLFRESAPRFFVMDRLRIHDFHRRAIVPCEGVVLYGPISLSVGTEPGYAEVRGLGSTAIQTTTGGATIDWNRPLQLNGTLVFDGSAGDWVDLQTALAEYLASVPGILTYIEDVIGAAS